MRRSLFAFGLGTLIACAAMLAHGALTERPRHPFNFSATGMFMIFGMAIGGTSYWASPAITPRVCIRGIQDGNLTTESPT